MDGHDVRRLLILGLASMLVAPINWNVTYGAILFLELRWTAIIILLVSMMVSMARSPPSRLVQGGAMTGIIAGIGPAVNIAHWRVWNLGCDTCHSTSYLVGWAIAWGLLVVLLWGGLAVLAAWMGIRLYGRGIDLSKVLRLPRYGPGHVSVGAQGINIGLWMLAGFSLGSIIGWFGGLAGELEPLWFPGALMGLALLAASGWAAIIWKMDAHQMVPRWGWGFLLVPVPWAIAVAGVGELTFTFCIFCEPPIEASRIVLHGVLAWVIGVVALWVARRRIAASTETLD